MLRPSEIDTFITCQKKWGFRYLDGIETPSSNAAKLGTAVHKVLETYLINNEINSETIEGKIASSGLKFLPNNIPKNNIEKKIFFELDGFIFSGTPDFFMRVDDHVWLLGDHKTCSSFSNALNSQTLKENIQANIYAKWLFLEKKAKFVKLKWIYYKTKKPLKAKYIENILTNEDNLQIWKKVFSTAKTIEQIYNKGLKSQALLKNTVSCFKYGRCPYYTLCKYKNTELTLPQLSTSPLLINKKTKEQKMNLMPSLSNSFDLFIDCVPLKNTNNYERTIELSELLKPVLEKIQKEKELKHYRLAGFGQHVGLISSYLSEHLKNNLYNHNTAILSSAKTPEGCDTLQTLVAAAGRVIRGF